MKILISVRGPSMRLAWKLAGDKPRPELFCARSGNADFLRRAPTCPSC